uniref:Uncharacterized protein n=1 Tax=Globodera pallida TaxID=36090 RepID=A0A183BR34_GLOPA
MYKFRAPGEQNGQTRGQSGRRPAANLFKTDDLNLLDVSDIHEDNLALFVDQGTTLKIDRYFALPPLPPSTVALDGTEPSALDESTAAAAKMDNKLHHHYLQQHRRSFSGSRRMTHEVAVPPAVFRVGEEVGRPQALFMQSRKDACAKLGAPSETYLCSKSQLTFTNKYPFYVNMPTSSKQSRKVSLLANAIRTENSFIAALRKEQMSEWKKRKDAEEKTRKMSASVQSEKREIVPNSASSHPPENGASTIDSRGSVSTDTVPLQQPRQTTEQPNASPTPTVTTVMPTPTIVTTTVGWTPTLAPAAAQLPPVETTAASNLRRGDSLGDLIGQTVARVL